MSQKISGSMSVNECAPISSIIKYLGKEKRTLVIPPWQREYVWKTGENGEVGELLSDMKLFLESSHEDYWLGSVILCKSPDEDSEYWLIDGQQRTLTLLLFMMAAKRYMVNNNLLDGNNVSHAQLTADCYNCMSYIKDSYSPRVKMSRGKADDILQSIFTWSGLPADEQTSTLLEDRTTWTQTQRNLAAVAEWIYFEKFSKDWIAKEEFVNSIERILRSLKIVEMQLDTLQNALEVFDRINDRGVRLNSSDLIKNRIFQHETDESFADISDAWQEMRTLLGEASLTRLKDPQYLLRALTSEQLGQESLRVNKPLKRGRKVTYGQLTNFWGDRLDPAKYDNEEHSHIKSKDFIKLLKETSRALSHLSVEKIQKHNKIDLGFLYLSRYLGIVQHYPVLLAGRHLSQEGFLILAKQVSARTIYYYLSGEKTQEFESLIPEWAFDIAALEQDADQSAIKDIYSKYTVTAKQFEVLEATVRSWSYKNSADKKKIRAVLSQLSYVLDQIGSRPLPNAPQSYFEAFKKGSKHGWDIDHISPRKTDPKNSIFHSIGNLVLLHPSDNRSLGEDEATKKADHYDQCQLSLTKTLVGLKANPLKKNVEKYLSDLGIDKPFELSTWNEEQIDRRTTFYCALLRHHLSN